MIRIIDCEPGIGVDPNGKRLMKYTFLCDSESDILPTQTTKQPVIMEQGASREVYTSLGSEAVLKELDTCKILGSDQKWEELGGDEL